MEARKEREAGGEEEEDERRGSGEKEKNVRGEKGRRLYMPLQ